jgi:hypothetical protein
MSAITQRTRGGRMQAMKRPAPVSDDKFEMPLPKAMAPAAAQNGLPKRVNYFTNKAFLGNEFCSTRSGITETQTWSMAIVISMDYKDATNTQ